MDLQEAREKFIEAWGAFGSAWGINRSMAQVHALLLISHEPLSTEEVMEQLNISRGKAPNDGGHCCGIDGDSLKIERTKFESRPIR